MNNHSKYAKRQGYNSLLQAIDFFTQKFNLDQLSSYAFELTNEVLDLHSSALFIKTDSYFTMVRTINYDIQTYCIEDSPRLPSSL